MTYVSDLVTAVATESLQLGDLTLAVEGFRLEAERPYQTDCTWNGNWERRMMGQKPCRLTVRVRHIPADTGTLRAVLRTELAGNTERAFSFAGMTFAGMRVTEYTLDRAMGARDMQVQLTMVGTLTGEATG